MSDFSRSQDGRNPLGIVAVLCAGLFIVGAFGCRLAAPHITKAPDPMNTLPNLQAIDISLPLAPGAGRASAWYVPPIVIDPVRANGFVGSVAEGGSVNFRDITFNPHGHGTHTECLGHITDSVHSVNDVDIPWLMPCRLVTVTPEALENGDHVITSQMLSELLMEPIDALVLRTLPNPLSKKTKAWSNTNPPYLTADAAAFLVEMKVMHLLLDLPSVDREVDGGALTAHHIFWGVPDAPRTQATITEMVYVPQEVSDGLFWLNLQTAPFVNDATPSRPLLIQTP